MVTANVPLGFFTSCYKILTASVGSVAPLESLCFHWTAICSSSIVFTPRSLFLLFVLLFSGLIVEDLTTAATSPASVAFQRTLTNIRDKHVQQTVEKKISLKTLNSPRLEQDFYSYASR